MCASRVCVRGQAVCCGHGVQVGAAPSLCGVWVGAFCSPRLFVSSFLVLSRFATKSMARRILGGWSGCTLMWFRVLSLLAGYRGIKVPAPV